MRRLLSTLGATGCVLILAAEARAGNAMAASCSAADIQAAVDSAVGGGGGTVTLPACKDGGNGSAWADGSAVCIGAQASTPLRVLGAGIDATVIQYASGARPPSGACAPGRSAAFSVYGGGIREVGNFTVSGSADDAGGTMLYVGGNGCPYGGISYGSMDGTRIHHVGLRRFGSGGADAAYVCSDPTKVLLFDHMYVGEGLSASGGAYGFRLHGNNDVESWEVPARFGTNTGVFIEDSVFNGTYHPVAAHGSAKYTVRYNIFSNHASALEGHGPSYGFGCAPASSSSAPDTCRYDLWKCYQGVQRVEVYNNTFNAAAYSTFARSGSWLIHHNTYVDQTAYNGAIRLEVENQSIGASCNVASGCPYQVGNAAVGPTVDLQQTCDATGRAGCWQTPRDVYIWENTFVNPNAGRGCSDATPVNCIDIADKGTGCLRQDQEFFLREPAAGDPRITSYTPYPYPHPLAIGGTTPDAGVPSDRGAPGADAGAPDSGPSTDAGVAATNGGSCGCAVGGGEGGSLAVALLLGAVRLHRRRLSGEHTAARGLS